MCQPCTMLDLGLMVDLGLGGGNHSIGLSLVHISQQM